MLLSTLRALDALAELGAAEHEDWDRTGDTVPSSPCPDDDAAARALVQQAHAEYFRVVARIEAVRRKIDRADSKVQRLENGPHSKTRNSDMARYKQDIERYLLEIEAMRPELAAAIERWKKLKARCGLRSKQEIRRVENEIGNLRQQQPESPKQMGAFMGARAVEEVQADIAEIKEKISKLKRDFTDCKYRERILDEQVNAYEDEITEMTRTGNYEVPDLRQKRQAQQQARTQSIDLMRAGESIQYRIKAEEARFNDLNYELSGFATARSTPQPA